MISSEHRNGSTRSERQRKMLSTGVIGAYRPRAIIGKRNSFMPDTANMQVVSRSMECEGKLRSELLLRILPWLIATLCLLPFLFYQAEFGKLLFFGDDWDQLSQMDAMGFVRWTLLPFAENTIPLFKALWGGSIIAFHGSYLAILSLLWLTHAVTIALFGKILHRLGFQTRVITAALLFFGLPASNIETLGWSVQWSAILSVLFMLLAWRVLISILEESSGVPVRKLLLYALLVIASALSFSRGLVSGFVLACFVLLYRTSPATILAKRAALTMAIALPVLLTIAVNPSRLVVRSPVLDLAATFGFGIHYLLLNPWYQILGLTVVTWAAACALGLVKLCIFSTGFAERNGNRRHAFLASLVCFDLLNAALLGYGRYWTGFGASIGSRYQYVPLLCAAPFVGIVFDRFVPAWREGMMARIAAVSAALTFCALLAWPWSYQTRLWSGWRGTEVRAELANGRPETRICYSLTTVARARELQAKYNLH